MVKVIKISGAPSPLPEAACFKRDSQQSESFQTWAF